MNTALETTDLPSNRLFDVVVDISLENEHEERQAFQLKFLSFFTKFSVVGTIMFIIQNKQTFLKSSKTDGTSVDTAKLCLTGFDRV